MRMRAHATGLALACASALSLAACHPRIAHPTTAVEAPRAPPFTASRVRSFTDTFAVTSIADSPSNLWVGTARGLMRWDLATGRHAVLTAKDGLPADRIAAVTVDGQGQVWAATQRATALGWRGRWQSLPPAPVGDFVTGYTSGPERNLWAGGPEGLARLRGAHWEHYLAGTGVTALAFSGGVLWVGTSGKGVLRVARSGALLEAFGAAQGCDVDVVRGLLVTDRGVLAVGDGPDGPHAAIFDGDRFYSYRIDAPEVIEWAARAGAHLYLGAGEHVWEVSVTAMGDKQPPPPGPIKLTPASPMVAAPPRKVQLRDGLPSAVLDGAEPTHAELPKRGKPKIVAAPSAAPRLTTADAGFHLPDGVTCVAPSARGLLVGTRFLGSERVENGVVRRFRIDDLVAGAERITVACKSMDECYLATGGARAWRFDGQSFEPAEIDPEPGSRVLAVLRDLKGQVLAIHRGATGQELRVSTVVDRNWTPISMQAVAVPHGAPLLNFAAFAPTGHLWLGLRYVDVDHDPVDFGAAEVDTFDGSVVYHRQGTRAGSSAFGFALPNDMVAMYWRSPNEAWFATRSGAARMQDGKVRVFTENDGMDSELIYDIGPGPHDEVWVATHHGTGRYDGTRWTFPKMGPFYRAATSLAHDANGHVFLGTDGGLFCVGDCDPDPIDSHRGLLDDAVLDITVDTRGRVWVLTDKGISIVEP
jgi:hypothetical protein